MVKAKFDLKKQALLEAYESGEFESNLDADRRKYLTKAAEETFKKDKQINIRISSRDLEALLSKAPPSLKEQACICHRCADADADAHAQTDEAGDPSATSTKAGDTGAPRTVDEVLTLSVPCPTAVKPG